MKHLSFLLFIGVLCVSCSDDYIGIPRSEPYESPSLKVSLNGKEVKVARKYVMTHDLLVTLGPCGGNNLTQIKKLSYIPNQTDTISTDENFCPTYYSATDWIGPYWMRAQNNGNQNSGFTGGWHAYNGDFTGSPTARTISVQAFLDGQPLEDGSSNVVCKDARIVVENRLQAGNTKEFDGSGREVLKETVTYHFHADTIAVSVTSEALEDITIEIYYGLQSCFGGVARMFCADSVFTCRTDGYHGTMARVHEVECTKDDGHQVVCRLDSVGLGTQDHYNRCEVDTNRQYCFTSPYGKTYFRLVGEVGLPLKKGQKTFWSGAYIFKESQ